MKQTQGWMTGLSGRCEEALRAGAEAGQQRRPPGAASLVSLLLLPGHRPKQGKEGRPSAFSVSRGGRWGSPAPIGLR